MKKIICLIITLVMLVSTFTMPAMALYGTWGSNDQIDAAIAAINKAAETNYAYNGISKESFVEMVRKYVPASTGVRVELSLTGHMFICKDATPYKAGYARADLDFYWNLKDPTSETYELLHKETIKFKIPKLQKPDVKAFADVASDAYYAEAVEWAVIEKITSGTSETTFSPDETCTRAQIITFIHRAYGSPAIGAYKTGLKDISKDDYFYTAACWAEANGLITSSKFDGNKACTRADVVTYLWKKAKSPKQSTKTQFSDVKSSASYAQAVNWAVKEGITSGTSDTTFSPNKTCTRGQIATMLFRAFAK